MVSYWKGRAILAIFGAQSPRMCRQHLEPTLILDVDCSLPILDVDCSLPYLLSTSIRPMMTIPVFAVSTGGA